MGVTKKIIIAVSLFVILCLSVNQHNGATAKVNSITSAVSPSEVFAMAHLTPVMSRDSIMDSIMRLGTKFIGRPYRSRVYNSWPLDCSGFAAYLYSIFGYELPHAAPAQALLGKKVPMDSLKQGDLMFFKGRNSRSSSVGHTAIFYKACHDTVYFLHSSSTGIRIDRYNGYGYYTARYLYSKRMELDKLKRIPVDRETIAKLDSALKILQAKVKSKNAGTDKSTHIQSTPMDAGSKFHIVKSGNTLSEISRQYGTSVDKLCTLNGIKKTTILRIGQKIRVK
ncbi:MAG: NlpC/P60 family protein [Bacteroidota bacterium]